MSGTRRRWGSLSASVARAGEGVFLESISGRSSGSGLAGREQGWEVLEIERDIAICQGSSRNWCSLGISSSEFRGFLAMSEGGVPRSQNPPSSQAAGLSEKATQ